VALLLAEIGRRGVQVPEALAPSDDDTAPLGEPLVEAFRVRERFFHFEFFRRPDGTLWAMEVNMRPPGGMTMVPVLLS